MCRVSAGAELQCAVASAMFLRQGSAAFAYGPDSSRWRGLISMEARSLGSSCGLDARRRAACSCSSGHAVRAVHCVTRD